MYILGIMSGTSLDGIDLALCKFTQQANATAFSIEKAVAVSYPKHWEKKLRNANLLSAFELLKLHKDYGFFIGETVAEFLGPCKIKPHYIASHGHTIFHAPGQGLTLQIGDGAAIAAKTGLSVISDFRNLDVCLGGQGAPLVPIGDELLFSEFDYCLNLGGFSNVSYQDNSRQRIAFDISPVNFLLNHFAQKLGHPYDKSGTFGREGTFDHSLLNELNSLAFYSQTPPKSLGREWVEETALPIIKKHNLSVIDILATLYQHISTQLARVINKKGTKVLVTGGGAFNDFLIENFKKKTKTEVILPHPDIINFKEALIFAFLGYRFARNEISCLKSVTGASRDSIGGCLYKE